MLVRLSIVCALAVAIVLPARAAERLTDKDIKALVSRIEQGRDRFDDALDGSVKRSILRGPSGEVNVDQFLNDFQESIDRLEERLKPEYAASAEAGTLLRQASLIDAYFRRQPAGTRGESEWNRLAADLRILATAYGAVFPLSENASVRRMGDREVAAAADEMARGAAQLKKALDQDLKKDPSVDKPRREAIVREADQLAKDAKALRDRVKGSKPSSGEAERLFASASKLQASMSAHQVPAATAQWNGFQKRLELLGTAYDTRFGGARTTTE